MTSITPSKRTPEPEPTKSEADLIEEVAYTLFRLIEFTARTTRDDDTHLRVDWTPTRPTDIQKGTRVLDCDHNKGKNIPCVVISRVQDKLNGTSSRTVTSVTPSEKTIWNKTLQHIFKQARRYNPETTESKYEGGNAILMFPPESPANTPMH